MNSTVTPPQADANGVLWGYAVDSSGHGRAIESSVAFTLASNEYAWYHLQFDAPGATAWLETMPLTEHIVDALTAVETRPKVISQQDGLLIVLRGVNTNPGAEPEDMVSIRLWITENLVISARRSTRRLLSAQDVRISIDEGVGPKDVGEFVTSIIERLADRIGDVVDEVDDELSRFETSIVAGHVKEVRKQLPATRRRTAAVRRFLAPQRDALAILQRNKGLISEQEAYELHQQADRMTRYVEELDLARERALVLQEELLSLAAEQQNARMYVLSVVSAIFLPLSFLTGVFGMNVAGLPGVENPSGFLFVALSMVTLALALLAFMRWRRWI